MTSPGPTPVPLADRLEQLAGQVADSRTAGTADVLAEIQAVRDLVQGELQSLRDELAGLRTEIAASNERVLQQVEDAALGITRVLASRLPGA